MSLIVPMVFGLSFVAVVSTAEPAKANPYSSPQAYTASADSFITDIGASLAGIGANLTVTKSIASADSVGQADAAVRLIQGTLGAVTVPVTAASQHSPGDHTTPATAGLNNFGIPGTLTIDALGGTALTHGYATACPSPTETWNNDSDLTKFTQAPGHAAVYPAGSRVLSKAIGKMAGLKVLGGTLGQFGAFTNYDTTTLYPTGLTPDSYGVQSTSTAEVSGVSFFGGAVAFSWSGFYPYVKAFADGVPGGAGTDYALPAVQVDVLGVTQNLSPGQTYNFGVPGVGNLSVTVGQPTQNVVSADGTHAEITVPLLTIGVSTLGGLSTANYDILPMHAVANMSAGTTPGIQCLPILSTITPDLGPTAGGQTVTITGQNFAQGATTVTIGGVTIPANQITVSPDGKTLTFVTPPHPPGTVPVTVTTPNGTSDQAVSANDPGATAGSYTYVAPPVITSPANGSTTNNPSPPITGTGSPGSTIPVTEGGTTLCTATVAPDGTWSCTPSSPLPSGSHTIVATQVTPGDPTLPDGLTQTSPPVTFTVVNASMSLSKTAGAITHVHGPVTSAGDTIVYTFKVTNTGTTAITNPQVTDPKITPTAINCGPSPLAPGATNTCNATYTLTQADVDAGTVSNTATASGTAAGSTITAQASVTTPITGASGHLSTAKTASLVDSNGNGLADAGETINYTITTTNTGSVTVSNVQVSDPKIPTLNCTPPSGSTLAPGAAMTCTGSYVVTQADIDSGSVKNTATATGTLPDGSPAPSTPGSATVPANTSGHLSTTKTAVLNDTNGNGLADAGESIAYTTVTKNDGSATINNVTVSDPKITGAPNNGTLSCNPAQPGTLAPGAAMTCTGTYTVTQADVDSGNVTNTATATGTNASTGTPPTSVPGTAVTPANPAAGLSTAKTASLVDSNGNGLADAGETINYTITTTN
ncbi:IPT/TIG domain-containing protein, partial [Arthrobacter sp. AZCC_0090]|uniref:DUF7507 domain-containing protein n=1 Tax=Arthrobacter sp. AZCC_0090 TaxID=2735881 RepID=UPI00160B878C